MTLIKTYALMWIILCGRGVYLAMKKDTEGFDKNEEEHDAELISLIEQILVQMSPRNLSMVLVTYAFLSVLVDLAGFGLVDCYSHLRPWEYGAFLFILVVFLINSGHKIFYHVFGLKAHGFNRGMKVQLINRHRIIS